MRIALVTKQFSESHGGVERVCVNLARGLAGRGHEVHVFAHRWDLEPEGVILHRVPMVSIFSWSKMLSFARNAKSRYEKENYDVVYVLTPALGGDIFRIGGLHRQWLAVKHPNLMIRWCFSLASPVNLANLYLENKIFSRKGYGVFVANSHMGKEHIILHYGIPADRIQVVYNGVDPEVFHPAVRQQYQAEVRGELGIPEDVPVVLFLAANWKRKGLETLLRALPEHGNYRAVVVGRERAGRYGKIVQVRGLGGKVVFSGPTTKPARFYGTADLFVLPSRYDPFANVCLEALACGLPVITTRENGASELIRSGVNGYVLDRFDDVVQLRKIILEFLRRPDRDTLRQSAAQTAHAYTAERTAAATIRVFEEAAEFKKSGVWRGPETLTVDFPLTELQAGKVPEGWQEIRHSQLTWVVKGKLPDGRFAFYKEFKPRDRVERWKTVFRGSRARRAQRGSALMRAKGFSAPQTIAAGFLPGTRSYLLCEALPGETLEDYYRGRFGNSHAQAIRKRQFIRELGRTVANIHRRGIIHGDLRGYNVLVEEVAGGWRFHFLDNERTRLSWSEKGQNWNLVQIATVVLPGLTITDRMRFFSAYRAERPELASHWKETAGGIHAAALRRLRKKGLVP